MRLKNFSALALLALLGIFVLGGCDMFSGTAGRITIKLKDAPFPYDFVAEANVTISRIEMLGASGTKNWLVADVAQSVNLLDYQNGATKTLVPDIEIPAGSYDRIRLHLNPVATVVLNNGNRFEVNSGSEAPVVVRLPEFKFDQGDDQAEALVDFDMDNSFAALGDASTIDGIEGFTYSPFLVAESFKLNNQSLEIPAE